MKARSSQFSGPSTWERYFRGSFEHTEYALISEGIWGKHRQRPLSERLFPTSLWRERPHSSSCKLKLFGKEKGAVVLLMFTNNGHRQALSGVSQTASSLHSKLHHPPHWGSWTGKFLTPLGNFYPQFSQCLSSTSLLTGSLSRRQGTLAQSVQRSGSGAGQVRGQGRGGKKGNPRAGPLKTSVSTWTIHPSFLPGLCLHLCYFGDAQCSVLSWLGREMPWDQGKHYFRVCLWELSIWILDHPWCGRHHPPCWGPEAAGGRRKRRIIPSDWAGTSILSRPQTLALVVLGTAGRDHQQSRLPVCRYQTLGLVLPVTTGPKAPRKPTDLSFSVRVFTRRSPVLLLWVTLTEQWHCWSAPLHTTCLHFNFLAFLNQNSIHSYLKKRQRKLSCTSDRVQMALNAAESPPGLRPGSCWSPRWLWAPPGHRLRWETPTGEAPYLLRS